MSHSMQAIYLGELRTEGLHLKSGNKVLTDAPTDNQGRGEAFSPTDLVCFALASCMLTTMGIVASRDQIALEGITAKITKVMSAAPRKIAEIHIHLEHPKPEGMNQRDRELMKHTAYTCPVARSLHEEVKQIVTFNF